MPPFAGPELWCPDNGPVDLSEVRLLGETVAVDAGGAVLPVGGPRRRAVLAFLALRSPRVATRAELVDALWGDEPPADAANAVQAHVSGLRKALGAGAVETAGDGYRLARGIDVDVERFETLVREGRLLLARGEPVAAAEALRAGLAIWRGRALSDLGAVAFAADAAVRLEEQRLDALEQRIEADLTAGRPQATVAELEVLVAEYPLREALAGQLMRALYASGRQADALSVYAAARGRLREELGLEPSAALRDLHRRLLAQTEPVASGTPLPKPRVSVPALLDETIGREAELDALTRLVSTGDAHLISVVGPGGVGKTRLATLLGHRLSDAFTDGVVFVPLADVQTADHVGSALCAALGVQVDEDGAWSTVDRQLRGRQTLLICDNFEHVVDAAPALARLLNAAPGARVVVTSRQRLAVRSEHLYWLEPLRHTADGSSARIDGNAAPLAPAVALFLARARAVDPAFDPGPSELSDIAAICASCDGLPLAIELAAARTRVLGIADLWEAMGSPLDILAGGAQDMPARHRALRANIAASVETTEAHLRQFLARLSVFRGGFTLAAAAAVADLHVDRTLDALDELISRSLVQRRTGHSGHRRFDLLATIREYLHERSAPDLLDQARRRHAHYYHQLMGPVPDARYARTAAHWAALLPERPNIRAALRWTREIDDPHLFADLVNAAGGLWQRLGPRDEFEEWLAHTIDDPRTTPGRVVDALVRRAYLAVYTGDLGGATGDVERARALVGTADLIRRAWVHVCAALVRLQTGDRAGATGDLDVARRAVESDTGAAELRWHVLQVGVWLGDEAARKVAQEEVLQFSLAHDLYPLTGQALNNACEVGLEHADYARVIALAEQGMRVTLEAEDIGRYGWLISQRGLARLETGDLDGAGSDLRTALELAQGRSLGSGLDTMLRLSAWCALTGRPDTAAVLVGAFDAATKSSDAGGLPLIRQVRGRYLDQLPALLGPGYDDAVRRGQELVAAGRDGVLAAALRLLDE